MAHLLNFICIAFGVTFLLLHPAPAWSASRKAKVSIPFTATVRSPFDNEDVKITGHLSVSTTISLPNDPSDPTLSSTSVLPKITAIARPAPDVTAIGQTFGLPYVVKGTSRLTYYWPITPTRITHTIELRVYPPPSSLPGPLSRLWLLQYRVDYGVNGQVTSMDATMVPVPDPDSESCSTVIEFCQ